MDSVSVSSLPTWAQAGFDPPDQSVPHVTGVEGSIVGVVFGDPLSSTTVAGHTNKILWVQSPLSQSPPSPGDPDLKIHATLNGSETAVDRVVSGGPGPSIVDMPETGCWTFNLSWAGRTDRVALRYLRGRHGVFLTHS